VLAQHSILLLSWSATSLVDRLSELLSFRYAVPYALSSHKCNYIDTHEDSRFESTQDLRANSLLVYLNKLRFNVLSVLNLLALTFLFACRFTYSARAQEGDAAVQLHTTQKEHCSQ
jgi:hypothetical protein